MTEPTEPAADALARERVLTPPLVVFLLAVLAIVGFGLWSQWARPTAAQAIVELADGDPDGDERQRLLRVLVEDAQRGGSVDERWAGALAAVALEDRAGLTAILASLGAGAAPRPEPTDADGFLHLGDPLLRNVLAAWRAEAAGARDEARRRWGQVATQCRFVPHPLAAELAAAAAERQR